MPWVWTSISPGVRSRPLASIKEIPLVTFSISPIAAIRPPRTRRSPERIRTPGSTRRALRIRNAFIGYTWRSGVTNHPQRGVNTQPFMHDTHQRFRDGRGPYVLNHVTAIHDTRRALGEQIVCSLKNRAITDLAATAHEDRDSARGFDDLVVAVHVV